MPAGRKRSNSFEESSTLPAGKKAHEDKDHHSNNNSSSPFTTVVYQGLKGSFTYQAAYSFFKSRFNEILLQPDCVLKGIFDSLSSGQSTYAVVPLESSSQGTIHSVYDRLVACDGQIVIVGELGQIESYCLCLPANNSTNQDDHDQEKKVDDIDIEEIICHPHILECCSDYLDDLDRRRLANHRPPVVRTAANDSAGACAIVSGRQEVINTNGHQKTKVVAAIASAEAASLHGLSVLIHGVGNDKNAETRYVILARQEKGVTVDPFAVATHGSYRDDAQRGLPSSHPRKASVALALRNISGAIFKMSSCFAFRNLDIIKIESRPASVAMQLATLSTEARAFSQRHWDLIFYLDYEPSADEQVNEAMFKNLQEYCLWIRQLGTYRAGLQPVDNQPSDWSALVDVLCR